MLNNNYELKIRENEELIVDVDDLMETELVKFQEAIKDLQEDEMQLFDNWVTIYKLLNYDIIDEENKAVKLKQEEGYLPFVNSNSFVKIKNDFPKH